MGMFSLGPKESPLSKFRLVYHINEAYQRERRGTDPKSTGNPRKLFRLTSSSPTAKQTIHKLKRQPTKGENKIENYAAETNMCFP